MKLIGGGMIGDPNYIGTSLNGLIQEVKSREINPYHFLQFFYLNKGYRMSHWVGHSELKQWDTNDFSEIKHIIEDM